MQEAWIPLTKWQTPEPNIKVLVYSPTRRDPVVASWYLFMGEVTWMEPEGRMDPPEFWLPIPALPR